VGFQDGSSETNWITMFDWFDRVDPWAYVTFGQVHPGLRAVRNTPDQFANVFVPVQPFAGVAPQPFARDMRVGNNDNFVPDLPIVRLYDLIMPINNSGGLITNVNLVTTNAGAWNQTAAFFAVSGSPGTPPVITQPAALVIDAGTGVTNAATGAAVANDI